MTTARNVIADFISDYYYGSVAGEIVEKDTTALLNALLSAPESVRLKLAVLLNPWRPISEAPKPIDPKQSIDLDLWGPPGRRAIGWWYEPEQQWIWECDGEPMYFRSLPAPPSEDKAND